MSSNFCLPIQFYHLLDSGKNGIAINLVDSEKSMDVCRHIEKHFQKKIHLLDADDSDEIEKIGS